MFDDLDDLLEDIPTSKTKPASNLGASKSAHP